MPRRLRRALPPLGVVLLAALLVACGSPSVPPTTITVSAAASLTGTFTDLAQQFEAGHPDVQVRLNLGPSTDAAVVFLTDIRATVFPFTTLDIAVMGRTPHLRVTATPSAGDRRAALATLAELGIDRLADRAFARLSGGERQLALIARALVQQAPVLALDEPTAALDYGNEVHILTVIADLAADGRSVLMTTHQPDHALAYATRAVLMRDGAVTADGPPAKVVTSERLTELYRVPIHVADVPLPGSRTARRCIPVPGRTDVVDQPATG
ncbi:MAG TPA: ATP-binding cassette domain-containing protein [Pseudonocardiaceae bacterium]